MVRAEVLPPRTPAACVPALRRQRRDRSHDRAAGRRPPRTSTRSSSSTASSSLGSTADYTARLADATITTLKNRLTTFKNAGFPSSVLQVDADPAVRAPRLHGVAGTPARRSRAGERGRGRGRRARARVQGRQADGAVRRARRQRRRDPVRAARRPDDAVERGCVRRLVRPPSSPSAARSPRRRCSPTTRTGRSRRSRSSTGSSTFRSSASAGSSRRPAQIQAQLDAFTNGQIAGGTRPHDRLRLPHRRCAAGEHLARARGDDGHERNSSCAADGLERPRTWRPP